MRAIVSGMSDVELLAALGVLAVLIVVAIAEIPPIARWRRARDHASREELIARYMVRPPPCGKVRASRPDMHFPTGPLTYEEASTYLSSPRQGRAGELAIWSVVVWFALVIAAGIAKRAGL